MPSALFRIAACLTFLVAGCTQQNQQQDTPETAALPLTGVRLRLIVVDDLPLAAAAVRLRGQWNALTGAEFEVSLISEKELAETRTLVADALICPAYQVGPLAERQLIAPLPNELIRNDNPDWSDLFDLLKLHEATWAANAFGVPFGSPVLTCYCRADLLEKLGRKPPQTWPEYQELARSLADLHKPDHANAAAEPNQLPGADRPWFGCLEPLGPGWAGLTLLARAAPYAKHRDNYSTLFDIGTMEPLIDSPPFVRALEELVAATKLGPPLPELLASTPNTIRDVFWQGRCGIALTWPTAAGPKSPSEAPPTTISVILSPLPGSPVVYSMRSKQWETRPQDADPHVPLLAVAGRMGLVSRQSGHAQAAFQLLFWLSGQQWSPQVSALSPNTTLFRRSHLSAPQKWTEQPIAPASAAQYATITAATFLRPQWLFAPRIPGRAEYLDTLDAAVHGAIRAEQAPSQALGQAASQWREITRRLGLPSQKAAYLHSLGLE